MFDSKRNICTWQWDEGDYTANCERYAVVSVDGEYYCEKHASKAPTSDR